MRYVYMNNFRGFTETTIPLFQTNFLVGENSTGKSSFLSLINLFSSTNYWYFPDRAFQDEFELGGFHDIVSAWAVDKSYFQVGIISTNSSSNGIEVAFTVHTFGNNEGNTTLTNFIKLKDSRLTAIILERGIPKYLSKDTPSIFPSEFEALAGFKRLIKTAHSNLDDYKMFPDELSKTIPLVILESFIQKIEKSERKATSFSEDLNPIYLNTTKFAPIRSKPQRIYEGMQKGYSPEGEHTPFLLRKSYRSRVRSTKFASRLAEFGNISGLFKTVAAHTFGKEAQAPFELLVKFVGANLNIKNVGYGVSQVLPLIVEFLSSEMNRTFVVQQPEVHLHPKAQAALGGLLFELAKEQGHTFFIETHSDFLIDRYRLSMRENSDPPASQVVFFERTNKGNIASSIPISKDGLYPREQPKGFRSFFIKEEMKLLDI